MNVAQTIEQGRRRFPNKPALIFEDQVFTYRHLDEQVNRMANVLHGLGLQRGDRVALLLPNCPEFVISYLGVLKMGGIVVSVSPILKPEEVGFILSDCGAILLITTAELSESAPRDELSTLLHILIAEEDSQPGQAWLTLMAQAHSEFQAVIMKQDEPAAILYTSGTTGFPKGATLSHGNIISNISAVNRCCNMQPDDRLLLFLPLFHCFGQNFILNAGLNAAATIVLQRRFNPELVAEVIFKEQITMLFGVPTVFMQLLEQAPPGNKFSSVHYCFTAAAPMPPEIVHHWQEQFNQILFEGYGLTETSPFASYNHLFNYKIGSIGTPIEHVEMRVVNRDGIELAVGEVGELVIRGPNVMLGYWNRPQETSDAIRAGWLHTGDLGWQDTEGYFYISDRLKDMVNIAGFKVYPSEVERVICRHPSVAEVAVYGVPDPLKGELIKASIRLLPNTEASEEEIITFCSSHIASYKVPRQIDFVSELPKNSTGKILKRLLRNAFSSPQST